MDISVPRFEGRWLTTEAGSPAGPAQVVDYVDSSELGESVSGRPSPATATLFEHIWDGAELSEQMAVGGATVLPAGNRLLGVFRVAVVSR